MLVAFAKLPREPTYSEPRIPLASAMTGKLLSAEQATDPAYWTAHARQPVRVQDAVLTLHAQGATSYLGIGPDGAHCALATSCLEQAEAEALTPLPVLRPSRTEPAT